jgi:SAM-dependent methyltransferase
MNSSYSDIIKFYNEYSDSFPVRDPSAVGWTNQNAQYKRFSVLFNIGILDSDRVLDYGCGLGHLNEYMRLNGYKFIKYFGIDINPYYIEMAKQLYPNRDFILSDIEDVKVNPQVDYVIGSGVFTYGITIDQVVSKIEKAYEISKRGVAFNFLDERSGLYGLLTYNAQDMVQRLSHVGDVKLIKDYLGEEDFTIYIKK